MINTGEEWTGKALGVETRTDSRVLFLIMNILKGVPRKRAPFNLDIALAQLSSGITLELKLSLSEPSILNQHLKSKL